MTAVVMTVDIETSYKRYAKTIIRVGCLEARFPRPLARALLQPGPLLETSLPPPPTHKTTRYTISFPHRSSSIPANLGTFPRLPSPRPRPCRSLRFVSPLPPSVFSSPSRYPPS